MNRKISTVFLDIDGTLTNNFHVHTKGWETILFYLKRNLPQDFFDALHGENTCSAIRRICEEAGVGLSEADLAFFVKLKNLIRDHEIGKLNSECLFPGVVSFLSSLREHDVRIVCCAITSARRALAINLGVSNFFTDYLCGESIPEPKSLSPSCFIDFVKRNGLLASECLVIDDHVDVLYRLKYGGTGIRYLGFGSCGARWNNEVPYIPSYVGVDYDRLLSVLDDHSEKYWPRKT